MSAQSELPLFARRLRVARERAGLTQSGLGVLAGIDEASASARINQYERGKHAPDFGTARRLAAALNVPTAYFYAEDDALAALIVGYHGLGAKDRRAMVEHVARLAKG